LDIATEHQRPVQEAADAKAADAEAARAEEEAEEARKAAAEATGKAPCGPSEEKRPARNTLKLYDETALVNTK
jgi:hypothetical protein